MLIVLTVALAGCLELIPQRVEQRLVIHSDGTYLSSYSGTFNDMYEVVVAIDKDKGRTTPRLDEGLGGRAQADLENYFQTKHAFKSIRKSTPHVYFVEFEKTGTLKVNNFESESDTLLGINGAGDSIPRLIGLEQDQFDNSAFELVDLVNNGDLGRLSENNEGAFGRAINKLIKGFDATVSIQVAENRVTQHNASSVKKLGNGDAIYKWKVRVGMPEPMKFSFYLGDRNSAAYKLANSPPGSSCKDVIGSDCACGPFQLMDPLGETPVTGAGYELQVQDQLLKGCTNSEGKIERVMVKRTGGPCSVTLMSKAESAALCPVKPAAARPR